jgi:serine/threonine protein kinase
VIRALGTSIRCPREGKILGMNCPVNPGDVLAGKYRVEEVIGEGGMGVVVAARHLELDQRVAMKFLLSSLTENKEATARFRREARAAVKIQSEHVARVLDVGAMENGTPYMVIEYLHGRDLAAELKERGKFDPSEAAELVLDACEAIAAAHVVGIVHRDLKPSNLFLTQRSDYSRCLKVLDFGISKSLTGDSSDSQFGLTRTRAVVGSPLYMAPEQLESSRNADERADIWSLGVILHELVTGSVPFRGESLPQLVRAVLVGDRLRPSALNPDLTSDFEAIIDRCLAHDREHRYASVTELAQDLAPFCTSGSASAMRVSRILRHSVLPTKSSNPVFEVPTRGAPGRSFETQTKTPRTQEAPVLDATAEAPTVSSWGNSSGMQRGSKKLWLSVGIFLLATGAAVVWSTQETPQTAMDTSDTTTPPGIVPPVTDVVAPGAMAVPSSTSNPSHAELETAASSEPETVSATVSSTSTASSTSAVSLPLAVNTGPTIAPKYVPTPPSQPVHPTPIQSGPVVAPQASVESKHPTFTNFGGRR